MRGGLGPQCRSPFCPVRSLCPTIPSIKYRPWCPYRAQRSGQGWLWGGGVGWRCGAGNGVPQPWGWGAAPQLRNAWTEAPELQVSGKEPN